MFWDKSEVFGLSSTERVGAGGEQTLKSFMGSQGGVTDRTTPEDRLESACRAELGGNPHKSCLLTRVHQEQKALPGKALSAFLKAL